MFQFIGYDFFGGTGTLRSGPSNVGDITSTRLANAIFDHFNVTQDTNLFGDTSKPEWTYETILNASFDGITSAGNLNYLASKIRGIKIKRSKKGTFDWVTIHYEEIGGAVEKLNFTFNDFLNAYGVEYEYALVPVFFGEVEGDYIIEKIMSKFSGVFIGDAKQAFKLLYDVNYSGNARKQQIGTFAPLGREFPIVVANGVLSYETGSVSADILNDDFDIAGEISRIDITEKKNRIKDYLTDKKPKILKDWNGNIWLVMITSDVNVEYRQGSGMGIPHVGFNWTEIGDVNDQRSLYDAGIVNYNE